MFRAGATSLLRPPLSSASRHSLCTRSSLSRYLTQSPQPRITHSQSRNFSFSHPPRNRVQYTRFGGSSSGPKGSRKGINGRYVTGAGVLAVVYYVAHLEQVPETGRWRFMNTSPQYEEKFGKMAREQTLQEYQGRTLPPNHPISRHVHRVVSRILTASNLGHIRGEPPTSHFLSPTAHQTHGQAGEEAAWNPDAQFRHGSENEGGGGRGSRGVEGHEREWDVIVVNDNKMINAMALPGVVIVFTGILPVCKDEQGLSAVLAHEVGHVVARHTAERISSQTITISLLFLAQLLGLDYGISNIVQNLLFELPNSRTQELEADKIGMTLMARACFDPRGAVEMFERMGRLEAKMSKNLEFMATHPSSATRVERLQQLLPEAYAVLSANPECAATQDRLQRFREVALGGGSETWV
ncbi:peptidase family M48-domain-containing protein [Lyophyllum atratum]|nr:peptidase family M48-domain-containing protein [Lyophyllum atratum]